MGTPFLEKSGDLLVLDTCNIVNENVVTTVNSIETLGNEHFRDFIKDRLKSPTKCLFDRIRKNKLSHFSQATTKRMSTKQIEVATLKKNCQLFSQMYIACQVRDGNLDEFFSYENQTFVQKNCDLRSGTK